MAHGDAAMGGNMLNTAVMNQLGPKIRITEVDSVRSYMFDEVATQEVLHIDRMGAVDVARALEKMAKISVAGAEMWVWVGKDRVTLKLTEHWRVRIMRDGAVMIKVTNYALIADSRFVLLEESDDGWHVVAKGETVTWDGTEEFFTPADIAKLAKEVAKRILEQAYWL
jgi:hypothetical protein